MVLQTIFWGLIVQYIFCLKKIEKNGGKYIEFPQPVANEGTSTMSNSTEITVDANIPKEIQEVVYIEDEEEQIIVSNNTIATKEKTLRNSLSQWSTSTSKRRLNGT